ncbi:MAG: UV DNA damage repair endonuclease UvsE [Erysipelotrichaceae bacterium]|nr:UV DNA damage repair endonuclease UvsE [Erysipelotrichaceae bacterium]
MKIGYACICLGEPSVNMRTCIMKFASEQRLCDIIEHNLRSLKNILIYNEQHHIQMFRITSDLIPFGSSPINQVNWQGRYRDQLQKLGCYIKAHGLRVSMHPGQYTVLNSPRSDVVNRSILDLQYHCDVLDAMKLDSTHKIIIHIGGVYGDKDSAIQRFLTVYQKLSKSIKNRLVIENDDHYYNVEDVWQISLQTGIPVVFDNLHHQILPSPTALSIDAWMNRIAATWQKKDGKQKIHYSEQAIGKRVGAHADSIHVQTFQNFLVLLENHDVDIMLEVKDKNLSACKAVQVLYGNEQSKQELWKRYQLCVLAHSPYDYQNIIRHLHQDSNSLFLQRIEQAFTHPPTASAMTITFRLLTHILNAHLDEKELKQVQKALDKYFMHAYSAERVLKLFYRLANVHDCSIITSSYLFLHLG